MDPPASRTASGLPPLVFVYLVASALPWNGTEFALTRIFGGWGVGAASMLSPLYIAEIAPARIRGGSSP